MQNHLQAMKKKKSMITCLETHLIWFVFLHIYKILFLPFVKINVAFLSARMLLCTFMLLWLLSVPFISQDDEIRAVYGSTFSSWASITAAVAASGLLRCSSSLACLLFWFPKWRAEGQVISLDLSPAPPPHLIHTIFVMSEHINLYHNHLRAPDLPSWHSLCTRLSLFVRLLCIFNHRRMFFELEYSEIVCLPSLIYSDCYDGSWFSAQPRLCNHL